MSQTKAPPGAATSTIVSHDGGLRFAIQVGVHQLIVDQPVRGGGEDAGPTPLDLLGASLGSCIALYAHKFLISRNLPVSGLRVEVSQATVLNPRRVGRFEIRVVVPDGIPRRYQPLLEAAARACPAHNTLSHGADVRIAVELPPS